MAISVCTKKFRCTGWKEGDGDSRQPIALVFDCLPKGETARALDDEFKMGNAVR